MTTLDRLQELWETEPAENAGSWDQEQYDAMVDESEEW